MFRVVLGGVYGSPPPTKRKYRQYSPTSLNCAYQSAIEGDLSVRKASKVYGVPMQTLRDRVLGHVEPDTLRSGPGHLFGEFEEAKLVEDITEMAVVGYPYTRAEVINTATEFAICLGKRQRDDKPLTFKWFYGFIGRWPELKVQRPNTISELRARATSRESVANFFKELHTILIKHNLKDHPECIYNVDEKGVQTNFKPNCVVGPSRGTTSVITSERSSTTTILGCGSVVGQQIPPYFVFAGARMRDELMEGASSGADGTVSQSGWSNGEVFQKYLDNHFIKFAGGKRPLILLYDGHRSHILPHVIDWATKQNIVLYVLPPHTSHILQSMDVGCFGPFSKIYSNECSKFQRTTGRVVYRYSVCSIACKAYTPALSVKNLQSAFMKSGIYPFNPEAVDTSLFESHELRSSLQTGAAAEPEPEPALVEPQVLARPDSENDEEPLFVAIPIPQHATCSPVSTKRNVEITLNAQDVNTIFDKKRPVFNPPFKSERRSISKIVAGKAITEPDVASKIKEYVSATPAKKSKPVLAKQKSKAKPKAKPKLAKPKAKHLTVSVKNDSPKPSTSGTSRSGGPIDLCSPLHVEDEDEDDYDDDDDDVDDVETCCVCERFQPAELANCVSVTFVKWAKCDFCDHWTHLIYCSKVRVIRRGDLFRCPHCVHADSEN